MAEADSHKVDDQGPQGDAHKIVSQHLGTPKRLDALFEDMEKAEVNRHRYAPYLTRIYDSLVEIARRNAGGDDTDLFRELMTRWQELEKKWGSIDDQGSGRIEIEEWRERKRALNGLLEDLGMSTTKSSKAKGLYPPLRLGAAHACPPDCPKLVKIREERRRLQ